MGPYLSHFHCHGNLCEAYYFHFCGFRMKRHKGQFASSKSKLDEVASCLSGWDPSQYNGEDAHQTQ